MSKKLRIRSARGKPDRIVELEEARFWDYNDPMIAVVVENELIRNYDELCALASRDCNKDKKELEVYFMAPLVGG